MRQYHATKAGPFCGEMLHGLNYHQLQLKFFSFHQIVFLKHGQCIKMLSNLMNPVKFHTHFNYLPYPGKTINYTAKENLFKAVSR